MTRKAMDNTDWAKTWRHAQLDVRLLQAHYVRHAYPRHSHDYYVICLIERGRQTFTHRGAKHYTPPGGVILINPGAAHTGEPADAQGFAMRSLYPTVAHMQTAAAELTGRSRGTPYFAEVRTDQRWARASVLALHRALVQGASALECEARFLSTLAQLIQQHADVRHSAQPLGRERRAVARARRCIEERFADGLSLTELAEHVALSPYYLLRVFRAEVGMPPHAYLDSVRIRRAQALLEAGMALARVAAEIGFSSQSHFTRRFKQVIGVTPGQYARDASGGVSS
jgi:AraC-like DNA-binding protein